MEASHDQDRGGAHQGAPGAHSWVSRATPSYLGRQANRHNFLNVHRNFSRVCDAQCQQQTLDFDVPSLADLCRRGTISQSYTKCAKVSGAIQARS
eukprot:scaffold56452_cov59-Phaeocystis_antarctica.AAC.10